MVFALVISFGSSVLLVTTCRCVCVLSLDASIQSSSEIGIALALCCTSPVQGILSIGLQYITVKRLRFGFTNTG